MEGEGGIHMVDLVLCLGQLLLEAAERTEKERRRDGGQNRGGTEKLYSNSVHSEKENRAASGLRSNISVIQN